MVSLNFVAGGGQTISGGQFELAGSVGQVDAGAMSRGLFELVGVRIVEFNDCRGSLEDVNMDCIVDLLDVARFVGLPISGEYQLVAGIDVDGVVDLLDVTPCVDLLTGG